MAEHGKMPIEIQACTLADFLPHIIWRNRSPGKNRAPGIGFRLKTEHSPNVCPFRVGQVPPDNFRHVIEVAFRHGKAKRVLERAICFSTNPPRQIGKRFSKRVKVGFRFYPVYRESVAPGLGHVDMHRDLAQASLNHQPAQKLRVFD